jgi:hypothetical protein
MSVEVPDELHRRATAAAASSGLSLREYVIAALELATKALGRARTKTLGVAPRQIGVAPVA